MIRGGIQILGCAAAIAAVALVGVSAAAGRTQVQARAAGSCAYPDRYPAQRDPSNPLDLATAPGANPLDGANFFVLPQPALLVSQPPTPRWAWADSPPRGGPGRIRPPAVGLGGFAPTVGLGGFATPRWAWADFGTPGTDLRPASGFEA